MIDRERLERIAHGQSRFQAENFVVRRNGFDALGCYRQASRELLARLDARDLLAIDIEEAEEVAELPTRTAAQERDRRRAQIRLRGLRRKDKELVRDSAIYEQIVERLDPLFAEMTEEELEAAEVAHWLHRLTTEARRDLATFGAVGREHLALIESVPREMGEAVLQDARGPVCFGGSLLGGGTSQALPSGGE